MCPVAQSKDDSLTGELRRILRTLGTVVAILAVLLTSVAAAVWLLFDPNDYKGELSSLVEERTGRSFAIENDLELTFFPWLGVQTGSVRLGNADGFGEEPFASAAQVVVRVRLLPLLSRRLEFGTVELDGLELNLARDGEGVGNWEGLLASNSTDRAQVETTTSNGQLLQDLNIVGIDIRDGIVFWREDVTEVRYVLSELSLDTGPIAEGEPVDAVLDFQLVGVDPAFTADLNVQSRTLIDLDTQRFATEGLELEFRVEDGQHDERATGRLEADIDYSGREGAIRISDAAIEADLTSPPIGPTELSFRAAAELTRLDLATQNAEIQGLSTTLGGSVVALWELSGTSLLDSPQLSGTVSVAQASLADALDLAGVDVEVERELGNFELSSQFTADGTTGNVTLTELEVTALDMSFAGEVFVTERETTGRIEAPPFNPTTIIGLLPEEELEGINLAEVGSLAVSVDFSVNRANQVFSLREITATIPGATFTGALDRLEGGRRLRGRIATNEIEPDVLLGLFPELLPEGIGPDRLGALSINTSFNYDASDDLIELDGLSAQAFGLRTTGDLVVQGLSDSPHLIGDLAIEPFSPRELFDRFDQPIPTTSDDTVFGSAAINASLDLNGDRGQLDGLHAYLDDTTVTGRFAVERFDDPRYVFDLQLDHADIDRYLRPAADDASPDDDSPPAGNLLLPTEPLSALALEGRVTVSDLSMAGLRFSNVSTSVLIENGIGRVESARADLYGGEFEGGLELDARAGGPLLSLHGSAVTIGLAPLMADLSGQSMFSGTGTFDLDLSGTGESLNDALATAAGNVDFSLRDGVIQGFNLNHTLCDVFNRLNNHPRPAPTDEQFTHFGLLRGTAQVSDGIARTYDLIADAPSLQVTGNGQLDLVSKNLNYDLEARLTEGIPITGCETLDSAVGDSIPLEISGTAREPLVLPDFGELLRRGIMDEVQDRLLERLLGN